MQYGRKLKRFFVLQKKKQLENKSITSFIPQHIEYLCQENCKYTTSKNHWYSNIAS